MVDTHCHLVPGVDDGAANVDIALAMIEQAASVGVTHIMTTPHIRGRAEDLALHARHQEAFSTLQPHIRNCQVALGCEVKVTADMRAVTDRKEFTFAEHGKYLLFELPFDNIPSYATQMLFELKLNGVTPIIAHPERIVPILKDPGIAVDLVANGALLQVTNSCLVGDLGETFQLVARSLVMHGLVSIMASDAHNVTTRTYLAWPKTVDVLTEIEEEMIRLEGRATFVTADLTTTNPMATWTGDPILPPDLSQADLDTLKSSVRQTASRSISKKRRFFFF
jgi:protein-tyrosine phosphatase